MRERAVSQRVAVSFDADLGEPAKPSTAMRWIAVLGSVLYPDGKMPLDMRFTCHDWPLRVPAAGAHGSATVADRPRPWHGRCDPERAEAELRRAFRWLG